MTRPVKPTSRVTQILAAVNPSERKALEKHLLGGTSADWLAITLTSEGYPVSASTIRGYRRAIKMHSDGSV